MKKNLIKHLTAICFVLILAGFYIFSIYPAGSGVKSFLTAVSRGQSVTPLHIEDVYTEKFPAQNFFVTINGGFQRLMGLRQVNDIVKLDNGYITYTLGKSDVEEFAKSTVDFGNYIEKKGIPFLYINAPFKINMDNKMLPAGVEDYSNENADQFLGILCDNNIEVLDLREQMKLDGIDHYASFFATDHHWLPETGMWACSRIVQRLSDMDPLFSPDERIFDIEQYETTIYEDVLLGSSGRRTGPLYAGRDDMTLIVPRFDTSFHFSLPRENLARTGSYRETIIFDEHLQSDDPYYPSTYLTYCGNDYGLLKIENRSCEEGLEIQSTAKRIVLIKDSFSEVVIPFLSLCYDDLLCIDMRALEGPLMPCIEDFHPDAVVVLYNPGAYLNNDVMFDFLKDIPI